jgi:hypothetical protein
MEFFSYFHHVVMSQFPDGSYNVAITVLKNFSIGHNSTVDRL